MNYQDFFCHPHWFIESALVIAEDSDRKGHREYAVPDADIVSDQGNIGQLGILPFDNLIRAVYGYVSFGLFIDAGEFDITIPNTGDLQPSDFMNWRFNRYYPKVHPANWARFYCRDGVRIRVAVKCYTALMDPAGTVLIPGPQPLPPP